LSNSFDDPHILPMINIYQLDREKYPLEHNSEALEAVAAILEKRVNWERIFSSRQELMDLVIASGGHIRQLMQLMQRACLTASGRGHSKIETEDTDYAIKQLQFSFERSLTKKGDRHSPFQFKTAIALGNETYLKRNRNLKIYNAIAHLSKA